MNLHLTPQPRPASSDPGTDKAAGWWWRATVLLTALFLGLRLAGITSWQWWAVLLPAEVLIGALLLALLMVIPWAFMRWASGQPRALDGQRNWLLRTNLARGGIQHHVRTVIHIRTQRNMKIRPGTGRNDMAGGSPDAPTERFRRLTRALEVPVWLQGLEHLLQAVQGASCARCGGRIENLSQGHYGSACLVTWTEERFHFCCPGDAPGCELQAP
jgi:hypothetical protein